MAVDVSIMTDIQSTLFTIVQFSINFVVKSYQEKFWMYRSTSLSQKFMLPILPIIFLLCPPNYRNQ